MIADLLCIIITLLLSLLSINITIVWIKNGIADMETIVGVEVVYAITMCFWMITLSRICQ